MSLLQKQEKVSFYSFLRQISDFFLSGLVAAVRFRKPRLALQAEQALFFCEPHTWPLRLHYAVYLDPYYHPSKRRHVCLIFFLLCARFAIWIRMQVQGCPRELHGGWIEHRGDPQLIPMCPVVSMFCLLYLDLSEWPQKKTKRTPGTKWDQSAQFGSGSSLLARKGGFGLQARNRTKIGKIWGKLFYLQLELFCLQLSFFAYSPLRPLLETLSHCKQKAPTVSKQPKL